MLTAARLYPECVWITAPAAVQGRWRRSKTSHRCSAQTDAAATALGPAAPLLSSPHVPSHAHTGGKTATAPQHQGQLLQHQRIAGRPEVHIVSRRRPLFTLLT